MNMQKVTSWAKANWLIILSCVVLVAALVAGPLIGSRMSKGLQQRVSKEVEADNQALGRDRIDYTVPDPTSPGAALVTTSLTPHALHNQRFGELRERLQRETGGVWERARDHNKNGHELLIEGLFPKPSVADERVLPAQFAEAYIVRAHRQLLEEIGARMPPDPAAVMTELQNYYNNQVMRIVENRAGNELSPEEQAELTEAMQNMRLGMYSQRASDSTVYADVSVFNLPELPKVSPTLVQCWDWQVRYWIHQDIVRAVAKANEARSGDRGVPGAVVKRLVNVLVEDRDAEAGGSAPLDPYGSDPYGGYGGPDPYGSDPYGAGGADPYATGGDPAAAGAAEAGPEIAPRDYGVSVTGRTSAAGSQNKHYDVRYVNVQAIVSSERLPMFLDAIAQTNFMTVVDMDLATINPAEHLNAGFYYGRDPVVSVSLRIETLWFREWTKPLMPAQVRENRGIPAPAPAAAPPMAPSPRPSGGDDDFGPG